MDVNQGDVHGVTPLMVAAALNHHASVSAIMDRARAGHLRVNVSQPDDTDFTALDYASLGGDRTLVDQLKAGRRNSAKQTVTKNRSMEVINNNIRTHNNNINNNHVVRLNSRNGGRVPYQAGEEIELTQISSLDSKDSNLAHIHHFAKEVRSAQVQSEAHVTPFTAGSSSRPASRTSSAASRPMTSSKTRSRSLERAGTRAGSRMGGRSTERPGSRLGARSRHSTMGMSAGEEYDDDDDIDLTSLRDLMGTVREAAREIREIVEPMKNARDEHALMRRRGGSDKEKKRRHRKGHRGDPEERRGAGQRHQVQAEVHVISEISGRVIPPLPPPSPLPPSVPSLDLDSPPPTPPAPFHHPPPSAFLHVENEELSQTWPRRGRSKSRDRLLSGEELHPFARSVGNTPVTIPKQNYMSEVRKSPPPMIPPAAARAERQILEKVYGRLSQAGGVDPLVAAINSSVGVPKGRLIVESRVRMVGRAREHWNTTQPSQQCLPHITVSSHAAEQSDDDSIVSPNISSEDGHNPLPAESSDGVVTTSRQFPPAPPWQDRMATTHPASSLPETRVPKPASAMSKENLGGQKQTTSLYPTSDDGGGLMKSLGSSREAEAATGSRIPTRNRQIKKTPVSK